MIKFSRVNNNNNTKNQQLKNHLEK